MVKVLVAMAMAAMVLMGGSSAVNAGNRCYLINGQMICCNTLGHLTTCY